MTMTTSTAKVAACAAVLLLVSALCVHAQFDSTQQWSSCYWPIQNQAQCGSCYAFSTAETTSNRLCISSGGTVNYNRVSPQATLDYLYSQGGTPCAGGYPAQVLTWLASQASGGSGICTCSSQCTQGCVPYISGSCGETASCTTFNSYSTDVSNCGTMLTASQAQELSVGSYASAIQAEIQQNGPVTATISVCQSFYNWYQNGPNTVYTTQCSPSSYDYLGGHAIKLTGWIVDNNSPTGYSWTIANSWGSSWGNNGYFNLPLGQSPSACGVENSVSTILLNGQTAASAPELPVETAAQRSAELKEAERNGQFRDDFAGGVYHHYDFSTAPSPAVAYFMAHLAPADHQLLGVDAYSSQVVAGAHEQLSLRTVDASGTTHSHTVRLFMNLSGQRTAVHWTAVPVAAGATAGVIAGTAVGAAVGVAALGVLVALVVKKVRARRAAAARTRVGASAAEAAEAGVDAAALLHDRV